MVLQIITEDETKEQPEISPLLQHLFRMSCMHGVLTSYKTLIALGNFWLLEKMQKANQ